MSVRYRRAIAWIRRDVRVHDNAALSQACRQSAEILPLFILDRSILTRPDTGAARVDFLTRSLRDLQDGLTSLGGRLVLRYGVAEEELVRAARETGAEAVFFNREYEPHLVARDTRAVKALQDAGVAAHTYKDQVLVEPGELLSGALTPYVMFGAYFKAWMTRPVDAPMAAPGVIRVPEGHFGVDLPEASDLGFDVRQRIEPAGETAARPLLSEFVAGRLADYGTNRDVPSIDGTSRLSRHLHFGTISPRTIFDAVRKASAYLSPDGQSSAESFIRELAWREFYIQVLYHYPRIATEAYQSEFDQIVWENDPAMVNAWRTGMTGYPIVDAAMRQLSAEGWIPNRVRMVAASFFVKHLLCDWRLGELHFMQNLVDGDIAANNGGWQWAAGTGPSAQPYFRIMNVISQGKRYDPDGAYVKAWVPELDRVPGRMVHTPELLSDGERDYLGCRHYPKPIVDQAERRQIALGAYRRAHRK